MAEILSPAGGPEQLFAAVQSGADAVYLGLKRFSARGSAVNFDEQQLFIVRRRDMSFLSDYFRRDARRYDNGFELY